MQLHTCFDLSEWLFAVMERFTSLQVIYELTQGERQLIEDLSLVKKVLVHHIAAPVLLNMETLARCSL